MEDIRKSIMKLYPSSSEIINEKIIDEHTVEYTIRLPSGHILKEFFVDNIRNGETIMYDAKGVIVARGTYTNDKLTGEFVKHDIKGRDEKMYSNGVLHGVRKRYNNSGILRKIIHYENGKQHGETAKYYDDGITIENIKTYVNGHLEGMVKRFNKSGILISKANYKNNLVQGMRYLYFGNGSLKQTDIFVNGIRNGEFITYNGQGYKLLKGEFKNDVIDGYVCKYWSEREILEQRTEYHSGMLISTDIYDENGILKETKKYYIDGDDFQLMTPNGLKNPINSIGKYKQDRNGSEPKVKEIKYYNEKGIVYKLKITDGSEDNFVMYRFYDDGVTPKQMEVRINGKRNGILEMYYEDGKLEQRMYYENNLLNGTTHVYWRDGNTSFIIEYVNDIRHGPMEIYNEQGKLMNKGNYVNGKIDGDAYEYWNDTVDIVVKEITVFSNGTHVGTRNYNRCGVLIKDE